MKVVRGKGSEKQGCDLTKHCQRRPKVVVCNWIRVANYNAKGPKEQGAKFGNISIGCDAAPDRAKVKAAVSWLTKNKNSREMLRPNWNGVQLAALCVS